MSVVIKKPMGRYGNQLCPYFVGRILSENLQFKLFGPTKDHAEFMLHDINLNYNQPNFQQYEMPIQQIGNHSLSDDHCNPDFDILETIKDNTPRKIILDGYFQKKKYFIPFRNDIKKWFNLTQYQTQKDDIAVHIRLDDLLQPKHFNNLLPTDYYIQAIESIKKNNVSICTDSPSHPFINYLIQKYNAKLFLDNEKNTISFLAAHNNLILSQGTFSFWAGFFCEGTNIINAIPKTGWNSKTEENKDIDLLLTGTQYKYIIL